MTWASLWLIVVSIILVIWHQLTRRNKSLADGDQQLEIAMLRKARLMFPGEDDIEALDSLYRHIFRMILLAQKEGKDWEGLKRESIAIFNAKNRAIIEAVRFEERYTTPHAKGHTVIPFSRS